jgi:hypothetical protein
MKLIWNAAAGLGLSWIVYFWIAVLLYGQIRVVVPNRNTVVALTMCAAALCSLAGKTVSRKWWAGVAACLVTLAVILSRVH